MGGETLKRKLVHGVVLIIMALNTVKKFYY